MCLYHYSGAKTRKTACHSNLNSYAIKVFSDCFLCALSCLLRAYTVNLIPCFVRISQRSEEESVQEALTNTVVRAMPMLGQFTNDNDIKVGSVNSSWTGYQ